MENIFVYETLIGKVAITEGDGAITRILFGADEFPSLQFKETAVIKLAAIQLGEYFRGIRKSFDVPVNPNGTPYMKLVWEKLMQIPYGHTKTYGQVASEAGNPKAARAVGLANNRNPIPIIIPCHRVIGSNGKLTGYRGGIEIKQKLLELEKGAL